MTSLFNKKKKEVKQAAFSVFTKDAVVILLILVDAFLITSFISYDSHDAGFNIINLNNQFNNLGGRLGAYVSSFLIFAFGITAFLIPLFLTLIILQVLKNFRLFGMVFIWFHAAFFILFIISSAGLVEMFFPTPLFASIAQTGGIIGYQLSNWLITSLNSYLAANLIFYGLCIISFSVSFNISWSYLYLVIGKMLYILASFIIQALYSLSLIFLNVIKNTFFVNTNTNADFEHNLSYLKGQDNPVANNFNSKVPFYYKVLNLPYLSARLLYKTVGKSARLINNFIVTDFKESVANIKQNYFKAAKHKNPSFNPRNKNHKSEFKDNSVYENFLKELSNTNNIDEQAYTQTHQADQFNQEAARRCNNLAGLGDDEINEFEINMPTSVQPASTPIDANLSRFLDENIADKKNITASSPKLPPLAATDIPESQLSQADKAGDTHSFADLLDGVDDIFVEPAKKDNIPQAITPPKNNFNKPKSKLPHLTLLEQVNIKKKSFDAKTLDELSRMLVTTLADFRIEVEITNIQPGPVVTRFEILPSPGVKISAIVNLEKDIARMLMVKSVRVVDTIVGKNVIGIEIPNRNRQIVRFRSLLETNEFQESKKPLTLALGEDVAGSPIIADLAKMPHLLVAGTTGSGKSIGINSMILSLVYKNSSEDLKLILVDPKMLELSIYADIPHLLTPVITDMEYASDALNWCVNEMDKRYLLMSKMKIRNIESYNKLIEKAAAEGKTIDDPTYKVAPLFDNSIAEKPPKLAKLPYLVVVIDEFADMIMVVGKEVETLIARIAQKARAAGIHLILATQRPSVNVITGLIKANIPSRISFSVSSRIDSRTILDQMGAEQLLGQGDMLYLPSGESRALRVHGAFVSDNEVNSVVNFLKKQGQPEYKNIKSSLSDGSYNKPSKDISDDYQRAYDLVVSSNKASISYVQRHLRVGYNKAANLIEELEENGVITSPNSKGIREILASS